MKIFTQTILSQDERIFLKGYMPADEHFTSKSEVELITNLFNLKDKNANEIIILRNAVVKYYSLLMDDEIIYNDKGEYKGRTELYWMYSTAMMSVVAVIDMFKYDN